MRYTMIELLLITASLLPPMPEVSTFQQVGDERYSSGVGVTVHGDGWQASGYIDGDFDCVTTVHYQGKVWHRTWTQ